MNSWTIARGILLAVLIVFLTVVSVGLIVSAVQEDMHQHPRDPITNH